MPVRGIDDGLRRALERIAKTAAYRDLLTADWGSSCLQSLVALTIRQLMAEDPDFADLEEHRDTLVEFVKRLQGQRDAFRGYPWTRFPRDLAWNGHLARMTGGEARVYVALLAACDARTLVTAAALETIATLAGRSPSTVSDNLTSLKRKGLIQRWAKKHPNAKDPHHYIWYTRILPEECCESAKDAEELRNTPVVPPAA